jgi:secondary thiamine-phosphate synthase enzyme
MKQAFIAVDGASKGNPGPAGIGIVIRDESGNILRSIGEYIGKTTNNFAEYTALIRALTEALDMGISHASVQTDSELMANQINGLYRVKNDGIVPLYDTVKGLMRKFDSVSVRHVLREKNSDADKLASKAAVSGGLPALETEEAPDQPVKPREVTMNHRISVRTSARNELIDITNKVREIVESSNVSDGICTVFVPHTTAGVTINENADPDVKRDMIDILNRIVPQSAAYRHSEGNSDAHVKASLMGFSTQIIVENGHLVLGTWQGIYFCEFDGPRNRQVVVRVG